MDRTVMNHSVSRRQLLWGSIALCLPGLGRAADPKRDRLIELKDASGKLFLRVTITYIGKTPDPAYPFSPPANTNVTNADLYTRTYQSLGASPIEFISTLAFFGDGSMLTLRQGVEAPTAGRVATLHADKPKFPNRSNTIAPGASITQRNLFVVTQSKPTMTLIQRTTLRYEGAEYTYDDELTYFER